ncbi:MAG: hypothetical protein RMJ16_06165 [Thermoguttaceae bacterium]|nr:hypothetical protein [Thermoguttaceae bacterium]
MKRWVSPSPADLPQAASELLELYLRIAGDSSIGLAEKRTLQRRLAVRLGRLKDSLRRAAAGGSSAKPVVNAHQLNEESLPSEHSENKQPLTAAGSIGANSSAGGEKSTDLLPLGGGASPDWYAEKLIELIETVVRPETWEVNGGRGRIFYWPPGQALIIRQTEEVHREVGTLLELLRRIQ